MRFERYIYGGWTGRVGFRTYKRNMLRHVSQPKSFEIITRLIGSPRQAHCFEILQLLKGAGRFIVFSSGPVKVQTPPWASVI